MQVLQWQIAGVASASNLGWKGDGPSKQQITEVTFKQYNQKDIRPITVHMEQSTYTLLSHWSLDNHEFIVQLNMLGKEAMAEKELIPNRETTRESNQ